MKHVRSEIEFLNELESGAYRLAWIISSTVVQEPTLINALITFNECGGSLFLFAEGEPNLCHANEFLLTKFNRNVSLKGTFSIRPQIVTFDGSQHPIFTGIERFFEGNNNSTFCRLIGQDPNLVSITPSSTVAIYDGTHRSDGRICLDCGGLTRLANNWTSSGIARYLINVTCWLVQTPEHRDVS